MKKRMTILGAIMIASTLLTSCGGGSIEKDAKEIAEIQCKAQKLIEKSTSGDMSLIEESTNLALESEILLKELEEKYTSDSDKKKLAAALLKAMGNCK
jgi:hypothetical protein